MGFFVFWGVLGAEEKGDGGIWDMGEFGRDDGWCLLEQDPIGREIWGWLGWQGLGLDEIQLSVRDFDR